MLDLCVFRTRTKTFKKRVQIEACVKMITKKNVILYLRTANVIQFSRTVMTLKEVQVKNLAFVGERINW